MSDTGLFIFMAIFFAIAIPAFFFSIWCARRQQAMQERYRGFFTRTQSFLFTNLLLAAVCSGLVGIASIFVMGSTSVMYFILAPLVALILLSIYRKLVARYGRMAAQGRLPRPCGQADTALRPHGATGVLAVSQRKISSYTVSRQSSFKISWRSSG